MGIREEIEKLETYYHRVLNYEYETINRVDVLSILDKWECVAEFPLDTELKITKHLAGQFMDEETLINIITEQGKFKLGDHIIIWRRKKR